MPAVQQFGIFAGLGTMISFVIGITLVPIGLTYLPTPKTKQAARQHRALRRVLEWSADLSSHHPWRILGVTAVLTVASLAGIPLISNNTDLVRFLKTDAPLYRDTMFIDEHLTGANTLEYVVARRDGEPLTSLEDVRRMAAFEQAILAQPHITGVGSILPVLRQLQRAQTGSEAASLPDNERDTAYAFDLLEAAPEQDLLLKLVASDFTQARFNVRLRAVGTAESAPVANAIEDDGRRIFGPDYRLDGTGAFYHIVQDSNRLVRAQVSGFGSALLFVFVTTGLVFRSSSLIGIALIAYVVPLLWTAGLMGAAGIDLSTGTAMIASAVLGMVVDDTIHYLAHFVRVVRDDVGAAVRETTLEMGTALVTNNLVQVLGFWVGCFGSFKPTIYFSLLSGVTMITALVCDLFVTPACLVLFDRHR
jgi:predicted RND superfamily exporter protein